jgi:uncharacterized repeat protein (TIGR03943 family)
LRERLGHLGTRLLGVGLASGLAAATLALALTDRLALYINPSSNWFAVSMAVLVLIGAIASFALPLGAEADHGHDHGTAPHHPDHGDGPSSAHDTRHRPPAHGASWTLGGMAGTAAVVTGGVVATGVVAAMVLVPPATLSAELAMSRETGAAPLFQGADTVALAASADTSTFGVGEWSSVFATATNPESFDGEKVTLTGFATPGEGGFDLTRLVITHCVIDAQPASIPVAVDAAPETGQWVTVTGTVRDVGGRLQVSAATVQPIDQPKDPYEY